MMGKGKGIFPCSVVTYPKEKILQIEKIIQESKEDLSSQRAFDSVEDLFADMGIHIIDE